MYYKIFNIINNEGISVKKSEINQSIRILNGREKEVFIFQRLSNGIIEICGVVQKLFLRDVLLVKTEGYTWILEPI